MNIYIDFAKGKIEKVTPAPIYFGDNNVDKITLYFKNIADGVEWYPTLSALCSDNNPIYPRLFDTDGTGIKTIDGVDYTYYEFTLSNSNGWNLTPGRTLFYVWVNYPNTNGNKCVGTFGCTILGTSGYYKVDNIVVNPELREYLETSFQQHYNEVDEKFESLEEEFNDEYTEEVNAQRNLINNLIGGEPRYVNTSSNILALTSNQGVAVSTDNNGHWYYWDGEKYVDSGIPYQATGLDDNTKTEINMIPEIADTLGLVYLKNTKYLAYPNTDMLTNIPLKKDVPYIINISTATSFQNTIYCYLYDSNNVQLATAHLSGATSRTVTFTPTQDYEGCYLRCVITWAGLVGVNTTAIISVDDNYISKMDKDISDLISNCGFIKPNLLPSKFTSHTYNGVTWTQNSDGTVSASGTASGLTFTNQEITLPRGKYKASIGNIGATTDGYHGFIIRSDQSYQYVENKDVEFEITSDTETFSFWLRFASGTTADVVFYPMIRNADVFNDKFVKYGEYQLINPLTKMINNTKFNWSGKKINVIGDSIVQGSYGNFINVIAGILNLSVARNYGVGGCRLSYNGAGSVTADDSVVARYNDMDNDADIILVHAGTNDYGSQIPLGDENSTDITTFNGALNTLLDGLRAKYPTKLIIVDTILSRYNENAFTIKVSDYNNAIKNACLRKHMICYDINYYSGFDFVKDYYTHYLTVDGLHPNQEGANIMGRKIAGFINEN